MAISSRDVNNLVARRFRDKLCCFHLNIRSARHKEDELSAFLNTFSFTFDIIMITETWYTLEDQVYRQDNYNTYSLNRTKKKGGGLAVLIKNGIDSQIVPEFSFINSDIECLTLKSRNYVYSVIYRPPDSSVNNFTSVLEKLFNYRIFVHITRPCI